MSTDGEHVGPVERSIRDAIARGEFDNLPGTGKPISDLDSEYDPDWWARRYVENMKSEDAAFEVRRMITHDLPFLRMKDRGAAEARIDELNALIAKVNKAIPESDRIEPISLSRVTQRD